MSRAVAPAVSSRVAKYTDRWGRGLPEALGEGDTEQESEQDLGPGDRDSELLQELAQLPVDPLLVTLCRHRQILSGT